ncbi:MAG: hypothetical protein AAGJ46_20490, partial [Planctomycetota bacterium]
MPPAQASPFAAVMTLAWREFTRFRRQRNRIIGALVQPFLFWLLFSEALGAAATAGYTRVFPRTLGMIVRFTPHIATNS